MIQNVVHIKTKEQWDIVMQHYDMADHWKEDWYEYGVHTCFNVDKPAFCPLEWYKSEGCTITTFEQWYKDVNCKIKLVRGLNFTDKLKFMFT